MYRRDNLSIVELQKNTKNIRNFCILAHVDHGKTTLADSLLASNGIISSRMSGKLRYMDSRPDEQERGITMKSSAISLIHTHSKTNENYVINLIDSPGHVDFSVEVSTAVRLCDGAAILIDACEGICPQTHAVLRQAWLENLKLVLVFNKIDRLILELKMTPIEAYNHLQNILEQFNAIVAQQFTSLLLEANYKFSQHESDETVEWDDNIDESKLYFSPKYNNVFFASSLDGWGFGVNHFADLYSAKLGFKKESLLLTLWGDYYLNTKTKRIMKNAQSKAKKPLFVQLILENLWQVYDSVYTRRDTVMTQKIISSLNIKINPRELKYADPRGPVQSVLFNWLPLGRNLLDMVIEILPSPLEITGEKVENLICSNMKPFKSLPLETQALKNEFVNCKSDQDRPVIVFISKIFATEKENIAKKKVMTLEEIAQKREAIRQRKLLEANGELEPKKEELVLDEENENNLEFLAFARVFSGTLKKDQAVFILSPKHNPENFIGKNIDLNSSEEELKSISKHASKFQVKDLYLMMGRELEPIEEVPCGNIVAIGGLENIVLKSATLSTTLFCPSFISLYMQTAPIVRVSIEPKNPSKIKDLLRGLKLLNQADPCVEIYVQPNGEHVLCTAGEVHLQRCVEDLVERYAKCEVNVSEPIVPFKETIVQPPQIDLANEKIKISEPVQESKSSEIIEDAVGNIVIGPGGLIDFSSNDRKLRIGIKARALPSEIVKFLHQNSHVIKLLNKVNQERMVGFQSESFSMINEFRDNFRQKLNEFCSQDEYFKEKEWKNMIDRILSFGPSRVGANILVDCLSEKSNTIWSYVENSVLPKNATYLKDFESNIVFGFNIATSKGPICEEPMQGVVFFLNKFEREEDLDEELEEKLNLSDEIDDDIRSIDTNLSIEKKTKGSMSSLTSQCISLAKEACRKAFEAQPTRLMAAMYKCEIMTVSSEALGKLYAVLGKRNAKITEETMKDNTCMFLIIAYIPVADSFGLSEEVRKRTSGLATLNLELSHFETIDIDPYWEPKTEDELLLYGEKADFENQARKYMNSVRKRKGLFVRKKLVEHSEKQRTLTIK
ncbi:elongation factor Tu GTP-binding domain-containing 1 [Brachionus plicatilis]|uniref:Ribosome assembly protein 1 n=1 Tax=Brachionus plicatilis TaxID=10195 RepID=A0A3M7RNZ2_BRAPC|nr:elongation factor Tu GTP-binding domain-containing 1 [Brachionus plicatilis]